MSPIRHDDDFRRTEIEDWDTWIEEQIQEAQERGEFDNLPQSGKPIEIYRTQLNPEYDLAFSRMKNAGIMPAWMELDRDVSRMSRELDLFLNRSATWLLSERDAFLRSRQRNAPVPVAQRPWWQIWQRLRDWFRIEPESADIPPAPQSIRELLRLRDHVRTQYLEQATALDKKIQSYHYSLPQGLSHLQRLRMLPDRAAKRFDARLPTSLLLSQDDDTDEPGGGLNSPAGSSADMSALPRDQTESRAT